MLNIDNRYDKDIYLVELVASVMGKYWLRYSIFIDGSVHKLAKKGTRPVIHTSMALLKLD